MQITISKSILENILVNAQPFLEKKDTSQITSHVFIDVSNSKLTIIIDDYNNAIKTIVTPDINYNKRKKDNSNNSNSASFYDFKAEITKMQESIYQVQKHFGNLKVSFMI